MGVSVSERRMRRIGRSARRAGGIYGIVRQVMRLFGSGRLITLTPCPGVICTRFEVESRGDVWGSSRLGLCGVVSRWDRFVLLMLLISHIIRVNLR